MIFIDANVFLAYDNARDVLHDKAIKLWQRIESGEFGECFTSDYVFNEIIGVTNRKFGKKRAIILGEQIRKSISLMNIDDHLLEKAWKYYTHTNLRLNLVDCTNVIALEILRVETIATFDKEFRRADLVVVQ